MNKAIAHILKEQLAGVPLIEKLAGLVQIAEYPDTTWDETGLVKKTFTKRIPISCDVNVDACEQNDLVPDSSKSGLLYFEDRGVAPIPSNRVFKYRSRLRLVAWVNTARLSNNVCYIAPALLLNRIITQLMELNHTSSGCFARLKVAVEGLPISGKELFSAYTYDNANTQYLLPPYESFAIDLTVDYQIHPDCAEAIVINPNPDVC